MNKIMQTISGGCIVILSLMMMFYTWSISLSKPLFAINIFDFFTVILLTIKNGWVLIIIAFICLFFGDVLEK